MRAVDIITRKRDGGVLNRDEITTFVQGVVSRTIPDYQTAALLMAIVLRGLNADETRWLTEAMARTGSCLDLRQLPGLKVDKHSTGGVGDKTSLVLAPLAAACGVLVPMMSGRGLGHTGGTLDKLESIPGFRVALTFDELTAALWAVGCAMIGQTAEIVPADRILYALRDVTGTVESLPLICASIMSKKIAEGIDALVLDVKTGSGAFLQHRDESRALAESLVALGTASGVRTEAVLTNMECPLGCQVGNALEVIECLEVLKGRGPADLTALSIELTSCVLVLGGQAADGHSAEQRVRDAISSGEGLERFRRMVEHQGGDPRVVDDYSRLPSVPSVRRVRASRAGFVTALDARLVGRASMALGAGRDRVDDVVDPAVGISIMAKPGTEVGAGDPVLELHYRTESALAVAWPMASSAVEIGDTPPTIGPIVLERFN